MRVIACSLAVLLVVVFTASAQQPGPENLDSVLKGWEKAMTDLKSFVSVIERTTFDKALSAKDEHKGYAMFLKAPTKDENSRARLELAKVSKPSVFEKYICTGNFLYEFSPGNKVVRVHDLPQNKAGGGQHPVDR